MPRQRPARPNQRGATLVVGLVLLVLMTLLVLASFRLGKSNLEIVGNMQHRNEGIASANQTIEAAVSSPLLTSSPASIFPVPCAGPNTQCYDVNADGTNDVTVTVTPVPACVKAETIVNSNLNLALANDRDCTLGVAPGSAGVEGSEGGNSRCSNSVWDIRAVAQDLTTRNTVVVNQGLAARVATSDVATSCP